MERSEVPNTYKWRTTDIFASDDAWELAFSAAEKALCFSQYVGTLHTADGVLAFLKAEEEVAKQLDRLYLYAHMKHDEDTRVSVYTAMHARMQSLYAKFSSEVSFAEPELCSADEEFLRLLIEDARLRDYDYSLKRMLMRKKHILSAPEEKLLAMGGEVYSQFQAVFSMIDNADIRFGEIEDKASGTLLSMLPEEMKRELAPLVLPDKDSREYKLAKAADKLSAYVKCLEECKAGNAEFKKAKEGIEKELKARELPCLDYFMENFLPGFLLTLDEMEGLD